MDHSENSDQNNNNALTMHHSDNYNRNNDNVLTMYSHQSQQSAQTDPLEETNFLEILDSKNVNHKHSCKLNE